MPSTDLDHLLRQTSPEVHVPPAAGPAMAATARSITKGERRPLHSTHRARRAVLAGELAAVCAGTA
ncbi:hypothetical protein GL325_02810 [Aeromicrobium sp. 636]|uniref:Uncharacterized protein n=1 Tax=Aeromicrobium senzhongii TaxID=2663859 RepID=A0A8I0JYU0_9ACTN|nr:MULTISPECIES: hypothetical protein [Aeromicrobium]MBC9225247.1 hypothetical protein [Aeromicrobium senzhongii]MCQ3997357.1 hypothetical protein [Aeromicrobium sp. 636]